MRKLNFISRNEFNIVYKNKYFHYKSLESEFSFGILNSIRLELSNNRLMKTEFSSSNIYARIDHSDDDILINDLFLLINFKENNLIYFYTYKIDNNILDLIFDDEELFGLSINKFIYNFDIVEENSLIDNSLKLISQIVINNPDFSNRITRKSLFEILTHKGFSNYVLLNDSIYLKFSSIYTTPIKIIYEIYSNKSELDLPNTSIIFDELNTIYLAE